MNANLPQVGGHLTPEATSAIILSAVAVVQSTTPVGWPWPDVARWAKGMTRVSIDGKAMSKLITTLIDHGVLTDNDRTNPRD